MFKSLPCCKKKKKREKGIRKKYCELRPVISCALLCFLPGAQYDVLVSGGERNTPPCLHSSFKRDSSTRHAVVPFLKSRPPITPGKHGASWLLPSSSVARWIHRAARLSAAEEDARDNLEYYAAKDDEAEENCSETHAG